MLDTGALSPNVMGNDATVGASEWRDVDSAKADDQLWALWISQIGFTPTENSIRIVKGGIVSGDEKSTGAVIPSPERYVSYGGSNDLWGLTWDKDHINASNFGVVFSVKSSSRIGQYLKATDFRFDIPVYPLDIVIKGILVEIKQEKFGFTVQNVYLNHIRVTVYYTRDWFGGSGENERIKNSQPRSLKLFKKNIRI